MNAGRDVEQLIAAWLVEEAPARAPDRILGDARARIDRTKQQRFAAAWREPMTISPGRLLVAAAAIVLAVIGAAWVGRTTTSVGSGPPGSPGVQPSFTLSESASPAAASPAVTLSEYRSARNAVCAGFASRSPIVDVPNWAADPSGAIAFLQGVSARGDELISSLEALPAPPEIRDEHLENLQAGRDTVSLIRHEIELLQAGKVVEAQAVDAATGPISETFQAFERKYSLDPCP
jgi:hypothetical protein